MSVLDQSVSRPSQPRLVVVDDEAPLTKALCDTLREEGFDTAGFTTAADVLTALREQEFDILLTDLQMPDMDGLTLLRAVQTFDAHLMVVVMTGHATIETAVEAMRLGAFHYVQKPIKLRNLLPVLTRALEVRRLRRENVQLREVAGAYELSRALGFTLDPDTILDKALEAALAQFAADEASVLLPTDDGAHLHVAAARGPRRGILFGQRMPRGAGIAGWVARRHEPLILQGPVQDPRFSPVFPQEDIRSALVVPMMAAGECIGVINVNSTQAQRTFSPGQLKALTILTGTVAPALHAAQLHARLRASEERLREITENLPLVLWMTDAHHKQMLYVNPAYERVWGKPCASLYADSRSWLEAIHPEDRDATVRTVEQVPEESLTLSYRLLLPDGTVRFIEDRSIPIRDDKGMVCRVLGFAEEVTARKNLEAQLRQAQKMEAFGQLAGGVAHDFNNLLTAINGFSELILSGMVPADKHPELLREIRRAGERAASLTRQLLAFSRKQMLQPIPLDLNSLVQELEKMLCRLIGEDVELVTDLGPALGLVKADPGQLEQVIMNLSVNARDAMPTGGRLTIQTRNVELAGETAAARAALPPGPYVLLAIADTGCGMTDEVKAHAFEPFFTTKGVGKGTGLGLAVVDGIVKQSGGGIEIDSAVGRGTTFRIYLPRLEQDVPSGQASFGASQLPRGTETILLIDDEDAVRETVCMILESVGYTVLRANSGDDGLMLCQQHQGPIHLLLCDVVMPRLSGRQVADLVRALRPEVKVLFMSGYTDDALARHGIKESGLAFLQKPLTPHALARKVREVLEQQSQRSAEHGRG